MDSTVMDVNCVLLFCFVFLGCGFSFAHVLLIRDEYDGQKKSYKGIIGCP